jgi:hypothetical protein
VGLAEDFETVLRRGEGAGQNGLPGVLTGP